MKQRESIVHRIPGGWYGNDPGYIATDPKRGSVTVDASYTYLAIAWLAKRGHVIGTALSQDPNPGLLIQYRLR